VNLDAALRDLSHADPRVRAQAADALGRVTRVEWNAAIPALVRAAEDAHPSVRYAALLSLGELIPDETGELPDFALAIAAAISHLGDAEPLVREASAIALGTLGRADAGDGAWQALAGALGSDKPEVRFQAVSSLTELDAPRAAPLLRPLLADPDTEVRAQTVAALGDAGDQDSREAIVSCLDDGEVIRWEAALTLARLHDARGARVLTAALRDRNRALDAATALAELAAARVALDDDTRFELRTVVSRWLGDPLMKVRAAEALALLADPLGRRHLQRASHARRDDVRNLAIETLARLDVD
jgi:HEAT repeat protein